MNTRAECEQTLLVQADFDGELDAAQAAALVRHRAECEECRAVEEKLVRARALLRAAPRYVGSPALRARVGAVLAGDQEALNRRAAGERRPLRLSVRRPWRWAPGWATAAAVVLASGIFFLAPRPSDIGAQVVNNHLRAMQLDSHLIDVVSTDHHTVKPWFAGKVDFAPPVKQLDADGYVLKGGRIDVVDARTAAVLVYQAGRHTVEVFIWPARPVSCSTLGSQQLNGFNLRHWEEEGFEIWCVSDMASAELDTFASRWRAAS
jgi:anti-sigma factor RsiW